MRLFSAFFKHRCSIKLDPLALGPRVNLFLLKFENKNLQPHFSSKILKLTHPLTRELSRMVFNPPHLPSPSRSPIPAAEELALRERGCRFRTKAAEEEEKQQESKVRQVHRRVTSPRRRERPYNVRPPQHLLLGAYWAMSKQWAGRGWGAGRSSRACWRAPRGRVGCETLPVVQLA